MANPTCDCGNPEHGFDCVCDWVRIHPGDTDYACEFCGIYTAEIPRCNRCECVARLKGGAS